MMVTQDIIYIGVLQIFLVSRRFLVTDTVLQGNCRQRRAYALAHATAGALVIVDHGDMRVGIECNGLVPIVVAR
eukprot:scaffold34653_cov254-Amphora_coffeaeformis.AAC.2